MNVEGLTGALWVEQDAQVNPVDLCMAYAKGAKANGVNIIENAKVTAVEVEQGTVKSITLKNGERIRCDTSLVNACGAWARSFR